METYNLQQIINFTLRLPDVYTYLTLLFLLSARHCAASSAKTQKSPPKTRSSGEDLFFLLSCFIAQSKVAGHVRSVRSVDANLSRLDMCLRDTNHPFKSGKSDT